MLVDVWRFGRRSCAVFRVEYTD